MKFALLVGGVVVLAAAAAFAATSQPAAPSPLAGDWRCNSKSNGIENALLLSVSNDGSTRGRDLINDQVKGHWVIIDVPYTGRLRIQDNELIEEISSFDISNGSVDGHQLPDRVKDAMRAKMSTGSARYAVEEISASRFVYSSEGERTLCERSPTPLRL